MSMYLDIADIAGESLSPNPDWKAKIEVQTMAFDVSQKTSLEAGGGLISTGAIFGALHITKAMDKSTPLLFGKLAGGEPIQTVTLRVSRPGAPRSDQSAVSSRRRRTPCRTSSSGLIR